ARAGRAPPRPCRHRGELRAQAGPWGVLDVWWSSLLARHESARYLRLAELAQQHRQVLRLGGQGRGDGRPNRAVGELGQRVEIRGDRRVLEVNRESERVSGRVDAGEAALVVLGSLRLDRRPPEPLNRLRQASLV